MNKVRTALLIMLLLLGYQYVLYCAMSDYIITFFIKPYPQFKKVTQEEVTKQAKKDAHHPLKQSKVSYELIKQNNFHVNQGIIAVYYGFAAISDALGQITFPRFAQKPSFNLLVTEKMKPVFMVGTTIHHWEVVPGLPAQLYTVEKKQDSLTRVWYWDVQKALLPSSNVISFNTITVLTNPNAIIVPLGITLTNDNPQLVLPTIYAKKNNNSIMEGLYYLSIRNFFGNIYRLHKKQKDTYFSTIIQSR